MKNKRFLLRISFAFFILTALLAILNLFRWYLLLPMVHHGVWILLLTVLWISFFTTWIITVCQIKEQRILAGVLAVCLLFSPLLIQVNTKIIAQTYVSPDGKETFVVEEKNTGGDFSVTVFRKNSPFTMQFCHGVAYTCTEKEYIPGNYRVQFNGHVFCIQFPAYAKETEFTLDY